MSIYTLMHVPHGIIEWTQEVADFGTFDDAMTACVKLDNTCESEHPDSYYYILSTKNNKHHCADYEKYGHHCDDEFNSTAEAIADLDAQPGIPF